MRALKRQLATLMFYRLRAAQTDAGTALQAA